MKRMVAFVDKSVERPDDPNDTTDKKRFEENKKIFGRLGEQYEMMPYCILCRETYKKLMEDCSANGQYHGIITHVPGNPRYPEYVRMYGKEFKDLPQEKKTEIFYGPSLDIIEDIHESFPESIIIAYTGAGEDTLPDWKLKTHGATHILRRGRRNFLWELPTGWESDTEQMLEWLDVNLK